MKCAAIGFGCVLLWTAVAFAKRPITFEDLYSFDQVGDVRLSPTGKALAFTLTHSDVEQSARTTFVYVLDLGSGAARRLTGGTAGEFSPRWSPDGRTIAFISAAKGGTQVWIASPESGQAHPVTDVSTGVGSLSWFPDGQRLLFASMVHPDCPDDKCNKLRDSLAAQNPVKARVYDALLFRHYSAWSGGKRNHVFVGDTAGSAGFDVTPWAFDIPPVVGGGNPGYAVAPEGSEVCFAMNTDSMVATSYNNDLFVVSVGGGEPVRLTTNPGNDGNPLYSPDRQYLAYLEAARPGYEADQRDIILYVRQDSSRINLTADFDRSVMDMVFSPDGRYIFFTAVDIGCINVYRVAVTGSAVERVLTDGVHSGINIAPDGRMLYCVRANSTQPGEIYRYDLETEELLRLTYYTKDFTENVTLRPVEEFWYYAADSLPIQGLLTYPPQFDPRRKYPLVLLLHGGPQWCWLDDFNLYGWNNHLVAAQGYVVAQINPRGSVGYGQKFCDAVSGDWGGKDYDDIMRGVDYLTARFAFIDTTRMAALGRSYGGYLTNWMCGHTDRFKCLVTVEGLFDLVSDYYSTDELWFPEWEFKGTPWTNRRLYEERSPERYVEQFKTPTLVIHGQNDYRADVSQGLMMFTALQRRGVPSRLLYFPDEGHSVSKLHNLWYSYEVQFEWLAKYLK